MRVALVTPTHSDPAHRRVARSLARALKRLGHVVVRHDEASARTATADVVHVHWFARGLGSLRVPRGAAVVLTHQAASVELIANKSAFRALAERAELVTTVSRAAARRLRVFIRKDVTVIPNGCLAFKGGKAPDKDLIVAVSRIAAYKGLDTLALAFAKVSEGRPKLRLVLCGPDQTGGRYARFLERLGLSEKVRLTGDIPAGRVERLLRRAAVFALPSRAENGPMALLEAMAAGCAIVATRTGGIAEAARHGREALLVPPGDPAALARALERLLDDASLARTLGAAAVRRSKDFHWGRAAASYDRAYRTLLRARPPKRQRSGSRKS